MGMCKYSRFLQSKEEWEGHGQAFHNVEGEIMWQMSSAWKIIFDGRWRRLSRMHISRVFWHMLRVFRFMWLLLSSIVLPAAPSTPNTTAPYVAHYYEHHDASLTATGWQQVDQLGRYFNVSGARNGIDLVVVSPLTRTLQTASGVFGGGEYTKSEELPPLMLSSVGKSPHVAISSSNSPPFVAHELCREAYGGLPCDLRSPVSKAQLQFPGVDFSKVTEDEDSMWNAKRETLEEIDERTRVFLDFLDSTTAKEIAVVSHAGFLTRLVENFGDESMNKTSFANCELRTVKMRKIPSEQGYTFTLSAGTIRHSTCHHLDLEPPAACFD